MRNAVLVIIFLMVVTPVGAASPQVERLLDAMTRVESGGNASKVGDDGEARGPLQIHREYHDDAGGTDYKRVVERAYSRAIVLAYWRRYCPTALRNADLRALARVHNGGPDGSRQAVTLPYWRKVQREMAK